MLQALRVTPSRARIAMLVNSDHGHQPFLRLDLVFSRQKAPPGVERSLCHEDRGDE